MRIHNQQVLHKVHEELEDIRIKLIRLEAALFIEEVEPTPEEIEAIREGEKDEREGRLIPFSEIRRQSHDM